MVHLDFETRSDVDLAKTGVFVYAAHRSTQVLCAVFSGVGGTYVWYPKLGITPELLACINTDSIAAWNASFEAAIWAGVCVPKYGWPKVPADIWHCTMAESHAMNHPGALDAAAVALKLEHRKDKVGAALMRKMCVTGGPDDAASHARLRDYCAQDVRTEVAASRRLLRLRPRERALWLRDQEINQRGVLVDRELVTRCAQMHESYVAHISQSARDEFGVNLTQVAMLQSRIADLGLALPDMQAGTLETALAVLRKYDPDQPVATLIDYRLRAAAVSPKKFTALLRAMGADDRVRGLFQFHGAGQTGRWSGRIVQPHNLPRPTLDRDELMSVLALVQSGADFGRLLARGYDVLEVLNNLIRPSFVSATDGLVIGDYEQIEARVLAWCAGEEGVLQAFRDGVDPYIAAYSAAFNIPLAAVTPAQRQIGKVMVLALGYGGGKGAFVTMGAVYGVYVDPDEADGLKTKWRDSRRPTVEWWRDLEHAAKRAVSQPDIVVDAGPVSYVFRGHALWCRLPSGRTLCYPGAHLALRVPPWEWDLPKEEQQPRATLSYYAPRGAGMVQDYTHGGKLAENVVQAISADVLGDALMITPDVVLHVHDEEVADGLRHEAALKRAMHVVPPWATGLPIAAKIETSMRYRK